MVLLNCNNHVLETPAACVSDDVCDSLAD